MAQIKGDALQIGVWGVIYCTTTDRFLFGKRSTVVNRAGAWNFFGGRVDAGEHPRSALVRELAEEATLSVTEEELIELDFVVEDANKTSGVETLRHMHFYLLRLHSEFVPTLNHEHSSYRWFRHNKLPTRFNRPTATALKLGILAKSRIKTLSG